MMSNMLFIVLIGCAVAFEFPINNQADDTGKEVEITENVRELLQNVFEQIVERTTRAIQGNANEALEGINKRLNTTVFKEASAELHDIFTRRYGHALEPQVSQAEKRLVKQECEKVGAAFEELIQDALEKFQNNSDEKVDATEFKKAVDNLKKVVENIFASIKEQIK